MKLSPRLQKIADLVWEGAKLADVGTDHAYLPMYLVEQGKISFAIATDLHPGPLTAAKKNAQHIKGIDFRLADGLGGVLPHEVDTIVMAGMGGETIVHILESIPWLKERPYRLILQPQSKLPEFMHYLSQRGFCVAAQYLVEDNKRIYPIYEIGLGEMSPPEGLAVYIHPSLIQGKDPLLAVYVDKLIGKFSFMEAGLQKTGVEKTEKHTVEKILEELRVLAQEVKTW